MVDGLKKSYGDRIEFRLLNVETDADANQLANSMGITGVPTFVFVNSDGIEAGRIVGSVARDRLAEALDALR